MNDIMYLYFDFDQKDQQVVDAIEKLLPGVDALLKDKGWEYTGFQNMYRPVKGTDPDETFDAAMKAVEEAEYLKGYKPFFKVGKWIKRGCPNNPSQLAENTKSIMQQAEAFQRGAAKEV